jgi:hypothetical protein
MTMDKRIVQAFAVILFSLSFYTLSVLFSISLSGRDTFEETQAWVGAVPVILEKGADINGFVSMAADSGYPRISHEGNQKVRVFSYDGARTVLLSSLSELYDESDPLYDSFLRKLPALFRGSMEGVDASVLYIHTDDNPNQVADKLSAKSRDYSWVYQVPGAAKAAPPVLLPVFLLLLMLFSFTLPPSSKILFFQGAVPFIFLALGNRFASLPALLLFPFLWRTLSLDTVSLIREKYKRIRSATEEQKAFIQSLVLYAALFMTVFLFFLFTAGEKSGILYFGFFLSILAAPASAALHIAFHSISARFRQHARFFPVSMGPKRERGFNRLILGLWGRTLLVSAAALIVVLFFSQAVYPGRELTFPWPEYGKSLELSKVEDQLPALGDFFAHHAYHGGYLYGMEYRLPESGETLEYTEYYYIENRLHSEKIMVELFTEQWYEDIITEYTEKGIITLILNQKGVAGFSYASLGQQGETEKRQHKSAFFLVFVTAFSIFSGFRRFPIMERAYSGILTIRSKQQAA